MAPWLERYAESRPGAGYHLTKRCLDLLLLVLLSPVLVSLLAACAFVTWLERPRAPVFFRQRRTGKGGRRFVMYKFRTMVPDAEERKLELLQRSDRRWPDFKMRDDPRVTRAGWLLRRTSLDELPQVWNVVKGEMSLVGPRPTSFGAETYAEWQRGRLDALPGITGLWQVTRRGAAEFDERASIDLAYVARRSLLLDLEILLRTTPVLMRGDRGGW